MSKPAPPRAGKQLSPIRQRFVEEYLKDLNQARAARDAGYAAEHADVLGTRIMKCPLVRAAIAEAIEARSKRTRIDADWLLKRLADEAEADVADLYAPDGSVKPVREWPMIWRKGLVIGVDVETIGDGPGRVTKFKVSDRIKRLELIGKHVDVRAFRDVVEHTGTIALTVTSEDASL